MMGAYGGGAPGTDGIVSVFFFFSAIVFFSRILGGVLLHGDTVQQYIFLFHFFSIGSLLSAFCSVLFYSYTTSTGFSIVND